MKRLMSLLMVLVLSLSVFSAASAAGPTGTYVSGIACVNLENVAGTFNVTFYGTDGTQAAYLQNQAIAANGSKMYYSPNLSSLPANFLGSAVIDSTVKLACSVNTQTAPGSAIARGGTSNGVPGDETGTKLYITQIMNNYGGFSSYVAVQNAGVDANVTAKYFDRNGAKVFEVVKPVKANTTLIFYQDGDMDGVNGNDLTAPFLGSATFESTSPLAGIVAMYNDGTAVDKAQFFSYNAFTDGALKLYAPRLVKNLSGQGWMSGFSCQNVGTAATNVSASLNIFNQGTGQYVAATLTKTNLAAGQAWAVYMGSTGNAAIEAIVSGFGSATFTSTASKIACTINEDNRTAYAPGQGSTYGAVPDGKQTNKIFFSQITAIGPTSYNGGFQVANTTATATTCKFTFSNGIVVNNQPLAANGSISKYAPSILGTGFNGSAIVECGQPIVGIYNMSSLTVPGDTSSTNNGINQ